MSDEIQIPVTQEPAQWWLAVDGATLGPHSEAYVISNLGQDGIDGETPACRVGDKRWRPLQDWPQFCGLFGITLPADVSGTDSIVSNRNYSLPMQFKLMVLYCLVFRPLWWVFIVATDLMSGGLSVESDEQFDVAYFWFQDHLLEFVLLVVFIVTGLQMRRMGRGANLLVSAVFSVSAIRTAVTLVAIVVSIVWMLSVPSEFAADAQQSATEAATGMMIACLGLPLWIASFCFEVYALVWWRRNHASLPRLQPDEDKPHEHP